MTQLTNDNIRNSIREKYRKIAILDSFGFCHPISSCCNTLVSESENISDSTKSDELINTFDSKNTLDSTKSGELINISDSTKSDELINTFNSKNTLDSTKSGELINISDSTKSDELINIFDSTNTLDSKKSGELINISDSTKTHDSAKISLELGYSNSDVNQMGKGSSVVLGCGNPNAIASLKSGETVLDLGSGSGFDCFLAVHAVGESGKVIGVDMTHEMISAARANAEKKGYKNVEFRLGEIEHLPIADGVIDVIISNCVINLSPEKMKVFNESFRVLKAGGRLAISDVVATALLPNKFKNDMKAYALCVSGASFINDIETMLQNAGFVAIEIKPKTESKSFIKNWMPHSKVGKLGKLEDYIVSATIEAIKPK